MATSTSPIERPFLPLSVFIIARNEADRIAATIASVATLTDDIVVIDSGSSDDTVAVATAAGARVLHHDWSGYGPQKRFAETQCRHSWVLNLDADECATPALRDEIAALFAGGEPRSPFWEVKIVTIYPHADGPRPLADYYPAVRLYDRRIGRFSDSATWDRVVVPAGAAVAKLAAPVLHRSQRDLRHIVGKLNDYTTLQAETQPAKSRGALLARLLCGFPIDFLHCYIGRRHITGGIYGFVNSVNFAYARFLKAAKMYEQSVWRPRRAIARPADPADKRLKADTGSATPPSPD